VGQGAGGTLSPPTETDVIFPLRYKLALLTSVLLVAGISTVSYLVFQQSRAALEIEIGKRGSAIAQTLARSARDPLLLRDELQLTQLVESIAAEPEIAAARLLDNEGRVVASSAENDLAQRERLTGRDSRDLGTVSYGGRLLLAARMQHRVLGKDVDVGEAQVVMDLDSVIRPLVAKAQREVSLAAGALLFAALVVALSISRRITRPLQRLRLAADALSAGDTSAVVPVATRDEVGELTRAFNKMSQSLHQKDRIERAFRRYVSDHVLQEVMNDPSSIQLKGERREVTVMFIDIRQFTRITSRLGPERLVAFLNEAFELITARLLEQGATVDKYVGDGILAYTGAPIPSDDHASRAVAAAIAIQRSVDERNLATESNDESFVRLEIGIGIHTGTVVVGNIGSERKMDFTAIGEPVNAASRLQELAAPGQILITGDVSAHLSGGVHTRYIGPYELKGLDTSFEVYEVKY
jgi:class 3 adenylate cyclase